MLYEVAIIKHPTEKEAEEGERDELVLGITQYVAKDAESAKFKAVQSIGLSYNTDELEVLVRPFVEEYE